MSFFVRAYLRASTLEQNAERAKAMLDEFAQSHNVIICNYYIENESGAHLERPELFRLLNDSRTSDVLLIEDVDRLSRLTRDEWDKLKQLIRARDVRIVGVNVPTTWMHLRPGQNDFDSRIFGAINDMLLDMLAAIARRDYEQRRTRQKQGIEKAKALGKYPGRKRNLKKYETIQKLLNNDASWSSIQELTKCSRSTISAAKKYKFPEIKKSD